MSGMIACYGEAIKGVQSEEDVEMEDVVEERVMVSVNPEDERETKAEHNGRQAKEVRVVHRRYALDAEIAEGNLAERLRILDSSRVCTEKQS